MTGWVVSRLRFCRRSGRLKIHFWKNIVRFGSRTPVPISWMCLLKNFSFAQFNRIRNHFFGCRIKDGWCTRTSFMDLIVAVLHGNTNQSNQACEDPCTNLVRAAPHKLPTRKKSHGMIDLDNIDFISSKVNISRKEALLYVFENNEEVIKMIIKGRSPSMRHISRTHRVALDWLSDRNNLDPKIQIKYIETKNQLADILTKGKFHA